MMQHIDTAPKDGTAVLLYMPSVESPKKPHPKARPYTWPERFAVGRWFEDRSGSPRIGYWSTHIKGGDSIERPVTHWQELIPPKG
jgi:hypothetical protein